MSIFRKHSRETTIALNLGMSTNTVLALSAVDFANKVTAQESAIYRGAKAVAEAKYNAWHNAK